MNWETFYLLCFLIGFLLSLVSFGAGALHIHLPGKWAGHGFHGHAHATHGANRSLGSVLNFGTITAFLAWFGGTGYILTRYSKLVAAASLGVAVLSGLAGGAVVFWFLFKVLLPRDKAMDPADYEMIGVLGQVSSPVREGGIGEMIFTRDGARRCVGIRGENDQAIPRGAEVVVTRYEKGIAYVCPWDQIRDYK
jgi:hypothetical protein